MKKKLKDIAEARIGYQLRGRLEADPNGTHRIIQMRDVDEAGEVDADALVRFTPEREASRYIVDPGTVLFQARGNANRAFVVEAAPENTLASNHFFIVTADAAKVFPKYLAWYLNSRPVQALLKSTAQGTTTMLVPKAVFDEIEVQVPPLEVQRKVAHLAALRARERRLASALDAKRDMLIEALCMEAAHGEKREEVM